MSNLKLIVNQDLTRLGASIQKHEKEGIEIEKGAILTEEYLIRHEDLFRKYCEFFSAYPDLFIDLITPSDSNFSLFFYQRIFLRACLRYRYHYCTACLTKGTPVLTEYGMMPIEQISGDIRVWTKDGWQYPLNLNIREWNGDFVSIEGENCFEQKITTTNDHKFLAVHRDKNTTRAGTFWKEGLEFFNITNYEQRKEFYRKNLRKLEKVEWIRADQLTENDFLLSPIDTEVRNLKEIKTPTPTYQMKNLIKDKILIDNNFCEWMGIWLAEGSWNRNQISFTISIKEESLKKRILFLAKEVFGLDGSVIERDNNSQAIYFNSAHLRLFFEKIFNCKYNEINQWNKWIPTCLLHIDPKIQLQIVKGWLSGDGYYRKNRNCYRYKGTTVSNVLVEGMKHILYRNFVNPSITIEDREGKTKVYNLNFNGLLAKEFKEAIDENRIVLIKENMRLGEYYPYLIDNKLYMINKVRNISFVEKENNFVYCLEMPNESFNVNGVEGHNCRAFSKTFISILALYLECMFMPGTKRFICAPGKNQSAKIAKDKIYEIWDKLPLLKKEIIGDGNFGKDYVTLMFRNGSIFDVVGALDTERGGRRHGFEKIFFLPNFI